MIQLGFLVLTQLIGLWLLARLLMTPKAATPEPGEPFPSVTVVIPAHNEVRRIGALLDSLALLGPFLPDCEVVVVDDRSTDGTATLARSYGVQVVELVENAPSQQGSSKVEDGPFRNPKARALQFAAGRIRGDVVVFFDADVVIRDPNYLLQAIVLVGSETRPLMVSVQPYHEAVGFVESLSLYPNVISLMASAAFTPLNAF
ncbi:MAG: glycosyltransferase, partial [Acidimicrobiales bacterium]